MLNEGDAAVETYAKQMAQLRRCIDRNKERPGIDTVFVVGDLNSIEMSRAQLEGATGLQKVSCETATHEEDGCIDHVMCSSKEPQISVSSCEVIATPSDHKMLVVEVSVA